MKTSPAILAPVLLLFGLSAAPIQGQVHEASIVDASCQVLDEIMAIPARGIPVNMLADAEAIVIIPNLIKGGFVVGVRHGRGIVVLRDEGGGWKAPAFVTLTGGSIGYQVGIQAIDLILVFKSRASVHRLMEGKFTIGADAAAAAGPVGRQAAAATDAALRAEIYSYSRSRGLFAGVSIDGSVLQVDHNATALYYATVGTNITDLQPGQPIAVPPSAARLLERLAAYTIVPAAVAAESGVVPSASVVVGGAGAEHPAEALRLQLADASHQLFSFLDDHWKQYLALPAEVYSGSAPPSAEALDYVLRRYKVAASDPKYEALARRPEFQATYDLLKRYADAVRGQRTAPTLALPQPPQ